MTTPDIATEPKGLWSEGFGAVGATLKELENRGVSPEHLRLVRSKPDYADRVAKAFVNGAFPSSTDTRIARIALGNSLFEMADWVRFFSAQFDEEQVQHALQFPWHEDILMSACPFNKGKLIKDTHTAFLGLPKLNGQSLTVAKWIELHPATGQPKFYSTNNSTNNPWHKGQPHTDVATLLPQWYLLLTEIVPGSTKKLPDEQVKMLPAEYELPSTIAETTKDLLVCHKTGQRPNHSKWARCSETTVETKTFSDECPSTVGRFGEYGLSVDYWYGRRRGYIGAGASRKIGTLNA